MIEANAKIIQADGGQMFELALAGDDYGNPFLVKIKWSKQELESWGEIVNSDGVAELYSCFDLEEAEYLHKQLGLFIAEERRRGKK